MKELFYNLVRGNVPREMAAAPVGGDSASATGCATAGIDDVLAPHRAVFGLPMPGEPAESTPPSRKPDSESDLPRRDTATAVSGPEPPKRFPSNAIFVAVDMSSVPSNGHCPEVRQLAALTYHLRTCADAECEDNSHAAVFGESKLITHTE